MKKEDVITGSAAAVELAMRRMGAGNVGVSLEAELQNRTKSDPSGAQFSKGDILYVPADGKNLFKNTFGREPSYGVVCPAESAGVATSKNLFFSALDRNVPEYKGDLTPSGVIKHAYTEKYHDVYDAIAHCATDDEVWAAIKGKTIYVADLVPVKAARWNRDGQITGTRDRNLPVFSFKKPE
jgi:hypothetical protein